MPITLLLGTDPSLEDLRQRKRRYEKYDRELTSAVAKAWTINDKQNTGGQSIKLGCTMWDFVHAELISLQGTRSSHSSASI
jgi:hypothetical protein